MHEQLELALNISVQPPSYCYIHDLYWDEIVKDSPESESKHDNFDQDVNFDHGNESSYPFAPEQVTRVEEHFYSLTSNSVDEVSEYPTNYSLTSNSVDEVSEYPQRNGEGVNVYKPAGTAGKDIKYFRCSCKEGSKTKHVHIPGGNTRSPLACQNAEIVRQAFAAGKRSVAEIKAIIRSLPSARCWGK